MSDTEYIDNERDGVSHEDKKPDVKSSPSPRGKKRKPVNDEEDDYGVASSSSSKRKPTTGNGVWTAKAKLAVFKHHVKQPSEIDWDELTRKTGKTKKLCYAIWRDTMEKKIIKASAALGGQLQRISMQKQEGADPSLLFHSPCSSSRTAAELPAVIEQPHSSSVITSSYKATPAKEVKAAKMTPTQTSPNKKRKRATKAEARKGTGSCLQPVLTSPQPQMKKQLFQAMLHGAAKVRCNHVAEQIGRTSTQCSDQWRQQLLPALLKKIDEM
ncbi:hypothetical protein BDZ90DRAFT_259154 [Jaminaea rosea]|uniref:Myb-like domain-containing protein n=1 Tax=Jaminaea rosea TaxID=1569628 RepID=A0A316UWC2_9BASI|nr:hypothetical protein BDZ90DRAFT_259154 [Jaminaea rosea]PWN29098.1 hypothetical protein BDZ90DRAFT_259154 [Jaminaea rosea]